MSQGPEYDNKSPWAWSDRTIVDLMHELDKVRQLVADTPNDMTLGAKVRAWALGQDIPDQVDP